MEAKLFTKRYRIISYKVMKRLKLLDLKPIQNKTKQLRPRFREAKLFVTAEEYIATALFTALLTTPIAFTVFHLFITPILLDITGPLAAIVNIIITLMYISTILVAFIIYPSYKLNTKRENLEKHLPYAAAHMATIAGTGVPLYQVFNIVGDFHEYKEVADECRRIGRNIDVFGYDTITAISEAAKETPSPSFKDLLWGLVSITRTGGDVRIYLMGKSNQFLEEQETMQSEFIETLEIMAEVYSTVLIAGPILAVVMLTVMGTVGGIPFPLKAVFGIMIYLLIPTLSIAFMLIIEGAKPEIVT